MRHLIIGNNVAASYASGLLADKAVDIQKLSPDGPSSLVGGEGIGDSDQIRFVQGTGAKAIVSPWIYGRNIVAANGTSNAAAAAHQGTVTAATDSTSAGEVVIKFVRKDGPAPEFFSFSASIATASNAATMGTAIHDAFEALDGIPDWLNPLATVSTGEVTFSGAKRGDVAQNGDSWEYGPVTFDVIVESSTVTASTFTAASGSQAGDPGVGDGNLILQLEKNLQGGMYGYYDRRNLPIPPATTAVAATGYDVYNIVATKDGSTTSAINGVDNLIEIMIVLDSSGTGQSAFEGQLNPYIISAGFSSVNL